MLVSGDQMAQHNGRRFTTKDRDQDEHSGNCAVIYKGAWWYFWCHASNLNGLFGQRTGKRGIDWNEPKKTSKMMIRRKHD